MHEPNLQGKQKPLKITNFIIHDLRFGVFSKAQEKLYFPGFFKTILFNEPHKRKQQRRIEPQKNWSTG